MLDAGFAAEQARLFEKDRALSVQITPENMKGAVTEKPIQTAQTPVESQL